MAKKKRKGTAKQKQSPTKKPKGETAAAKRKEQMEDPATVTQFAAVFYLLKLGRPMTDIEHTPDLLRVARTPAIAVKHWKDDSAWQIAEALYSVMRKQQSQFAEVMRDAANSPGMGISQLWQSLSKQPITALEISKASHTVTHGVSDFPYHEAIGVWLDAANKKGRYVVASCKPPQAPCSSQAAIQPAASEPRPNTPPSTKRPKRTKAEQAAEPRARLPKPNSGRWVDRDCNAALNMQRIGESRWRPSELCYWPDQGALPAKNKEYPGWGTSGCETSHPRPSSSSSSSSLLRHSSVRPLLMAIL
ncbi:hypothetical protein QJQ45_024665 [Haematococcus lacustris]|nr:hypothetical protein QJQ45_024665 [Haematococcus lacustris]